MIIGVETTKLVNNKLSPNDYVICYLLFSKEFTTLKECFSHVPQDELRGMLESLSERKFIRMAYMPDNGSIDFENIFIRQAFIDVLQVENTSLFEQFRSKYPKSTPNGRKLHVNLKVAKKKYLDFLKGNLALHNLILKCVEYEVKDRLNRNSLDYMQNISTYINQESWSVYFEDVEKQEERIRNGEQPDGPSSTKWTKVL